MKIFSINNQSLGHKNNQNFSGLWGKTKTLLTDYDEVIGATQIIEEAYYYPFADESKSSIDSQVIDNTSSKIINGPTGRRQLLVQNCKVCETLPISYSDYGAYLKLKDLVDFNLEMSGIHVLIKDKYTDTGFNNDGLIQKSAVNPEIQIELEKKFNVDA